MYFENGKICFEVDLISDYFFDSMNCCIECVQKWFRYNVCYIKHYARFHTASIHFQEPGSIFVTNDTALSRLQYIFEIYIELIYIPNLNLNANTLHLNILYIFFVYYLIFVTDDTEES